MIAWIMGMSAHDHIENLLIMAESNFVDYVKIYCRSGKGGRGSTQYEARKIYPNGGPDGVRWW